MPMCEMADMASGTKNQNQITCCTAHIALSGSAEAFDDTKTKRQGCVGKGVAGRVCQREQNLVYRSEPYLAEALK